jgi:hypothetical protein
MAITLDVVKKQMIQSAYDFVNRWGYPITQSELKTAVKAHDHKISSVGWKHDMDYLIDCGLLRTDGKSVLANASAVKSLSEMDSIDA